MSFTLDRGPQVSLDTPRGGPLSVAMLAPPWITVPPAGYGGVEAVVADLTDALVDRGHDVTLFCAPGSRSRAKVVALLDATHPREIERSLYNQLTAAQDPGSGDWCYYTPLEGVKHNDKEITCCHSSGPRALALAPTLAYLEAGNVICVNTLETSRARFQVGGRAVEIGQESQFPFAGRSTLTLRAPSTARFTLKIRAPAWAEPLRVGNASSRDGWITMPERDWRDGDQVTITFNLGGRVIHGDFTNYSRVAYAWGPYVLAFDDGLNREYGASGAPQFVRVIDDRLPTLAPDPHRIILHVAVRGEWDVNPHQVTLVPFAEAGAGGQPYAVWLRAP